jgi:aerobic-type carbon monoxide dehydrogenase small subunit (CoxS/CutS family)
VKLAFQLDGQLVALDVDASQDLLSLLRGELGRRSVRRSCEDGSCGSCTVLLDDQAINACSTLACQVQGRSVSTLEGLRPELRGALEEALVSSGATACGFCLPGLLLRSTELVTAGTPPEDLPEALAGNRCRCTGYQPLMAAIAEVLRS